MKIVHELNQLDYGGVERVIRNIVKYDKKNEHTILAHKDGPYRKELEKVGAKVVVVGPDDEVDMQADVIHIHTGGGTSQLAQDLEGSLPVVETIHSPVRSRIPDCQVFQRVGVCESVSRINDNCKTILNGIDFDDDEPIKAITKDQFDPKGKLVVGRVGRLGQDKGLEEWLLVCYYLQQAGLDFVPLIVGGEARGCDGYLGKLRLMAESLPVKNVVWAGHQDDTRSWYSLIDVFLYPSRTEGFGLVFAEAMDAGCAVVAFETPVTRELFAGYAKLVPLEKGITGLVEETKKVLSNAELRDAFRSECQGWVQSEFQAEAMSLQYQELYDECNNAYPHKPCKSTKTDVVLA